MKQRICPLDGKPCETNCPDRYADEPAGGCLLTTVVELGGSVINLGGGDTALIFQPSN